MGSIHNSARSYCIGGAAAWRSRYTRLSEAGLDRRLLADGRWTYTQAAYGLIARVNLLACVLREVEYFVPADFASLDEAREFLMAAGETACDRTIEFSDPTAIQAVAEERANFVAFLRGYDPMQAGPSAPLPYRRVLRQSESRSLASTIERRWGKWAGGRCDRPEAPDVLTLHVAAMAPAGYASLRATLAGRGFLRVYELREGGGGCEVDLAATSFAYNGEEGFWSDADASWLVYVSHEASITFAGGWLVESMQARLPEAGRYVYRGWDATKY